jgi:8-oxo-dGTP pyrophosphatase MutT (NUDIX family)
MKPLHPRVGVAVNCFARLNKRVHLGYVALVERATEPAKGMFSVPGGKLELGELVADAARREMREELNCSIHVVNDTFPAFTCTDAIYRDKSSAGSDKGDTSSSGSGSSGDAYSSGSDSNILFHYTLVHVLATIDNDASSDTLPALKAGDDAAAAAWVALDDCPGSLSAAALEQWKVLPPHGTQLLSLRQLQAEGRLVPNTSDVLHLAAKAWALHDIAAAREAMR